MRSPQRRPLPQCKIQNKNKQNKKRKQKFNTKTRPNKNKNKNSMQKQNQTKIQHKNKTKQKRTKQNAGDPSKKDFYSKESNRKTLRQIGFKTKKNHFGRWSLLLSLYIGTHTSYFFCLKKKTGRKKFTRNLKKKY